MKLEFEERYTVVGSAKGYEAVAKKLVEVGKVDGSFVRGDGRSGG